MWMEERREILLNFYQFKIYFNKIYFKEEIVWSKQWRIMEDTRWILTSNLMWKFQVENISNEI